MRSLNETVLEVNNKSWVILLGEKLKVAYCEEMNAWYLYMIQAQMMYDSPKVAQTYTEIGNDEFKDHSNKLLKALKTLYLDMSDIDSPYAWSVKTQKHPYTEPIYIIDGATKTIDVDASVRQAIANEYGSIDTYNEILRMIEFKLKDPQHNECYDNIYNDIQDIIKDEESHIEKLKSVL